jgi:hypothetical protein
MYFLFICENLSRRYIQWYIQFFFCKRREPVVLDPAETESLFYIAPNLGKRPVLAKVHRSFLIINAEIAICVVREKGAWEEADARLKMECAITLS